MGHFVGLEHLFPEFPGRHLHYLGEIAVIAGNGMKANHFRDIQNGKLGAPKQVAGLGDPGIVDKIKGRGSHDIVENPAEMCGGPVTQIGQILHGKLLHIVILNIV